MAPLINAAVDWLRSRTGGPGQPSGLATLDFRGPLHQASAAAEVLWQLAVVLYHESRRNAPLELPDYIPAQQVGTQTSLTQWAEKPILAPPYLCRMCGDGYVTKKAFEHHCSTTHGGIAEYRKRVAYIVQVCQAQMLCFMQVP